MLYAAHTKPISAKIYKMQIRPKRQALNTRKAKLVRGDMDIVQRIAKGAVIPFKRRLRLDALEKAVEASGTCTIRIIQNAFSDRKTGLIEKKAAEKGGKAVPIAEAQVEGTECLSIKLDAGEKETIQGIIARAYGELPNLDDMTIDLLRSLGKISYTSNRLLLTFHGRSAIPFGTLQGLDCFKEGGGYELKEAGKDTYQILRKGTKDRVASAKLGKGKVQLLVFSQVEENRAFIREFTAKITR